MGKTFCNLTWDDLCDLMCGGPEDEDTFRYAECGNDPEQNGDKLAVNSGTREGGADDSDRLLSV